MAGKPELGLLHAVARPVAEVVDHPAVRPGDLLADAVRAVAADVAAACGRARVAPGLSAMAAALFARTLRFDAADPRWADRDRFVLSCREASPLLYALLHLTGHAGMERSALEGMGQLDSPCAVRPEHGEHPAIEASTGGPAQGLAAAVGMALAERLLAARFGRSLVDHRTWALVSGDDMVSGLSHEAASLAGELRLERLVVLWDEAEPGPENDDALKRFAALGWAARRVDGQDGAQLEAALAWALRSRKPTLLACRTVGPQPALPGWRPFELPEEPREAWDRAGRRGQAARRAWLKRLANHPLRVEFERVMAGKLPESWHEATASVRAEPEARPTGQPLHEASRAALAALAASVPELVVGSARGDEAVPDGLGVVGGGSFTGRLVLHRTRTHGMAGCLNGLALHGGLLPCGAAPLVASDSMRPALRMAALMRQRLVHVFTDDGLGSGEDGPTRQPVEHLASLRAMPGLLVFRPADAIEAAECWELALRRTDGPSAIVLSRLPAAAVRADAAEKYCARGGYVLLEADGPRQATLIASGSEVALALEARALLWAEGVGACVVSLPSWELFARQDESYRAQVLGGPVRIGIEAACGFGWERWLGEQGAFIGMEGFGASAPAPELLRHFGITPEAIATAVRKRLPQASSPTINNEGT